MLATKGDHVPTGAGWTHEVKWDGMRVLVDRPPTGCGSGRATRTTSRSSFPELHPPGHRGRRLPARRRGGRARRGHPDLRRAAGPDARPRRHPRRTPVREEPGDADRLRPAPPGRRGPLRPPALRATRAAPRAGARHVPDRMGAWQVPPTYDDGPMLLAAAEQQGLEGIVSKRTSSRYRPGLRSKDWLKFPIRPTGSFVVGGFRHETGSTNRLGAVLVGQPTAERARVPRPGRQRHRRQGGPAAGRPAHADGRGRLARSTPSCRGSTGYGTVWVEPTWWSTCSTSGSPPTDGCGSPRTVASAPT